MIEITSEQIDRVETLLGNVRNAPYMVFYNAVNRSLLAVKTQAKKEVTNVYNISSSAFSSNSKISTKNASNSNMVGNITFAGSVIPLIKFKVSPSIANSKSKKGVIASVLKATGAKTLNSAYVTNLGRFGIGVFERETSQRNSSKQLYGPSAAHMVENSTVINVLEQKGQEMLDKRIEHEITRILNGYGGKK